MRVSRTPIRPEVLDALARSAEADKRSEAVANRIRDEAARTAPRRTGNLARNIVVIKEVGIDGQSEYRVGWGPEAPYGPLVELGTEDTSAQPHLRPAADQVSRSLRSGR